jgi:hypothetical protein
MSFGVKAAKASVFRTFSKFKAKAISIRHFAKLKRAFDAQRSQPFLILSSERDTNRAAQSLNREFREIQEALTIISFVELEKIYDN